MNINKASMVLGDTLEEVHAHGILLPQQYYGVMAGPRRNDGERDLMLAVLEDGIRTYVSNRAGKTACQRRLLDEVKAWIDTRGDRAPFSFETICETFDIEADDLRRRMNNLSPEKFQRRVRNPKRSRTMQAA